jgi:hypothetical protein
MVTINDSLSVNITALSVGTAVFTFAEKMFAICAGHI